MTIEEKDALADEIKEIAKIAIEQAINEERNKFFVPAQDHYDQHLFIKELMDWQKSIKSGFWKTTIGLIVTALGAVFLMGILFWVGRNIK